MSSTVFGLPIMSLTVGAESFSDWLPTRLDSKKLRSAGWRPAIQKGAAN